MQQFQIKNFQVSVADTQVVKGVDLAIKPGELHVIMGPNGSGKSSMAAALAGHPDYTVDGGSIVLNDENLDDASPDERANAGLFLAFQYPIEIPGVSVQNFLRHAHEARFADQPKKRFKKILEFRSYVAELAKQLHVSESLLTRGLNEGFSGGEKKRLEILQMAVLEPKYAILDETDSGLDIDAVRQVAEGVEFVRQNAKTGMLVITHYRRILQYLKVDTVHVMVQGKLVESGGQELVDELETHGYARWNKKEHNANTSS